MALPLPAGASAPLDHLTATLDALVARQLPSSGWTFSAAPGGRPEPATYVMELAERLAAPIGLARWDLVVVRSPGTPAAGLALLGGYRLTGRPRYLEAARRTGDLLVAIQLPSGGWFSEMPVEDGALVSWFPRVVRRTTLDDDVTPGAIRFLLELWEVTDDARYRRSAERGLALLLRAQLRSGAWPLVLRSSLARGLWSTFEDLPSLNDAATAGPIDALVLGSRVLGRPDLLAAARRGGDWLSAVRGRPPQAAWSQQYDPPGHPAQARRFEPAALASWETRHAVDALLTLAEATGDRRYCAPVGEAVAWLVHSAIAPGCWARLYEIGSNAPVYMTADGSRVDSPEAGRPQYDWVGDFGIPGLLARLGLDRDGQPRVKPITDPAPDRIPGDPGTCPAGPGVAAHQPSLHDARRLIAEAAVLLARIEPRETETCTPAADVRLSARW